MCWAMAYPCIGLIRSVCKIINSRAPGKRSRYSESFLIQCSTYYDQKTIVKLPSDFAVFQLHGPATREAAHSRLARRVDGKRWNSHYVRDLLGLLRREAVQFRQSSDHPLLTPRSEKQHELYNCRIRKDRSGPRPRLCP